MNIIYNGLYCDIISENEIFFKIKIEIKRILIHIGESYGEVAADDGGGADFSFRMHAGCERKWGNNVPYRRRSENRREQGEISPCRGDTELSWGEGTAGVLVSAKESGGSLAKLYRDTVGSWSGGSYHCRNGRP